MEKNTSTCIDPWLRRPEHPTPHNLLEDKEMVNRVSELIKEDFREWDKEQIEQMFALVDVKEILSIPLSEHVHEESWTWYPSSNGSFTVKKC